MVLAKSGFDTAENEPCKVHPLFAYRSLRFDHFTFGERETRNPFSVYRYLGSGYCVQLSADQVRKQRKRSRERERAETCTGYGGVRLISLLSDMFKLFSSSNLHVLLKSCASVLQNLGDLYAESGQILQGSFSAASKQASKQARSSGPSRREKKRDPGIRAQLSAPDLILPAH